MRQSQQAERVPLKKGPDDDFRDLLRSFAAELPGESKPPQSLHSRSVSYWLEDILLGDARVTAERFWRDVTPAVRSSLDHILIQHYAHTGYESLAAGRPIVVGSGDVVFIDLAQAFAAQPPDPRNFSLIIPRRYLKASAENPQLHGMVLRAGSPLAMLLTAHFKELLEVCRMHGEAGASGVVAATASLIAAVTQRAGTGLPFHWGTDRSQFGEVCRYIANNLADRRLNAAALADQFAISRPSLYRMFARHRGVARYIRERRLELAASILSCPQDAPERRKGLARRCGFASENAFSRAFKERYGYSPIRHQ